MARWIVLWLSVIFIFTPKTVLAALTINDVSPATINSADDVLTISATASGLSSSTQYLQVAFSKEGLSPAQYLGITKNLSNEWYLYKSSPASADFSAYFYNFTPVSSTWSGQIQAKLDTTDNDFLGPGNYILKLFKYITSSTGTASNNTFTVVVNVASPSSQTVALPPIPSSPNIILTAGTNFVLGVDFTSNIKLENFDPNQPYYLKFRAGTDENTLNKGQTKNSSAYLSDTESWSKFPQISTDGSGKWEGQLTGRVGEDKSPGSYKIRLRVKRLDNDSFYDSEIRTVTFSSPPPVVETPKQISAPINQTNKNIDINLVLGTTSAATVTPTVSNQQLPVSKNQPSDDKKSSLVWIIFVVLGTIISFLAMLSIKFKIWEKLLLKV